ncbi:MAG: hypothetical protein ACLRTD_27635 [Bacteroides sp.]|uniref:Uncharacterized protein n=1 Tax=Bacteroides intestinalis TaxID=329854 RepID=A0A412XYK0_9BACE|nr:hypothetical protein DWW10_18165 [Bacteroides intestinalis]RHA56553.1 hypothetical protein DW932_19180 [Bacteroides intestinalis]RHL09720.1 hypothetical protein DW036_09160 [Bacteroides sp. AF39-11AC]
MVLLLILELFLLMKKKR